MKERLLAVVAHQDDETFWFGGTLAKCAGVGIEINLLVVTDGSNGTGSGKVERESLPQIRREECLRAVGILGIKPEKVEFLNYPDKGVSFLDVPKIVASIYKYIEKVDPAIIITDNEANTTWHQDHVLTAFSVNRAVRTVFEKEYGLDFWDEPKLPYPLPFSFKSFLTYNLPFPERYLDKWGWINVAPEKIVTVDIGPYVSIKEEAANCYKSQSHLLDHLKEVGFWERQSESFIERLAINGRTIRSVPMPLDSKSYLQGRK